MPPHQKKTRTLRKTQKRGVSFSVCFFRSRTWWRLPRSWSSKVLPFEDSEGFKIEVPRGRRERNESSRRWFEKRTGRMKGRCGNCRFPFFGKIHDYVICKRDAKRWMCFFLVSGLTCFNFCLGQWQLILRFWFNYLPNVLLEYEC